MSLSLVDALQGVKLEPGRIYECQVGSLHVEVRVKEIQPNLLPTPLNQADVMLDPWTDLPAPQTLMLLQAQPGGSLLPDVPQIPIDCARELA